MDISFQKDHTELNIACWDAIEAKRFRNTLFSEHQEIDLSSLDAVAAIELLQKTSIKNKKLYAKNQREQIQGRLVALDINSYGAFERSAAPSYKVRYK